jgi:hypothetical protein
MCGVKFQSIVATAHSFHLVAAALKLGLSLQMHIVIG